MNGTNQMVRKTREHLFRMARLAVMNAIHIPGEKQQAPGYQSYVITYANQPDGISFVVDADNWGTYSTRQVDQVQKLLTDAWEQEQGGPVYEVDDDDPPTMPSLEDALARLAMESPEAARAASNYLAGTDNLRTIWVRFRVSERERTQIDEGMRAAGVEKISEYCRGKVLG